MIVEACDSPCLQRGQRVPPQHRGVHKSPQAHFRWCDSQPCLDLQDVYPTSGGDSRQDGRRLRCGVEHLGSRGNHFGVSDGKETYVNGIVVTPSRSPTPLPGRSAHSSQEPVSNRWRPCRFRRGDPHRPAPQQTMEPSPVVRGKTAIPVGRSRPDPASAAACRSCRWEDASAVEIVGPVVEVGPQILDGHVGVWEVPVTKASVRTQHLHEDRKIEASVVLGCCLKQLGSVETLRRPRRPSCLMPCFPGRRVGPST